MNQAGLSTFQGTWVQHCLMHFSPINSQKSYCYPHFVGTEFRFVQEHVEQNRE